MSDKAPEHIDPSPYLTWLISLSPEEADRSRAEGARLATTVEALVTVLRQVQPDIPLGIWLHALRIVWQDLEQQLRQPKRHS